MLEVELCMSMLLAVFLPLSLSMAVAAQLDLDAAGPCLHGAGDSRGRSCWNAGKARGQRILLAVSHLRIVPTPVVFTCHW